MFGEAFEIHLIVRETRWRRSRGREGASAFASPAVRLVSPVSRFAFVVALAVSFLAAAPGRGAEQAVTGDSAKVKPRQRRSRRK